MKVSIITATYNSSSTISNCISSVNNQNYSDIEQIIIDGKSSDNTLQIIYSQDNRVITCISEVDCGIYDAMNKGIALATGEIIAILNSDDMYVDNFVIEKVVDTFKTAKIDCVYADLFYVDKEDTNKIVRHWKTEEYKQGAFYKGWHPAHPSFFLKKKIYSRYGDFDLSFHFAADFELMLRMLEKHRISSIYLPKPLVRMRLGGATNRSLLNIYRQNLECIQAFKKNGLNSGSMYPVFRLIPKLKQFFV